MNDVIIPLATLREWARNLGVPAAGDLPRDKLFPAIVDAGRAAQTKLGGNCMTEPADGVRFTREVIEECLDLLGEDYDEEEPTQVLADRMFRAVHQNAKHREEVLRRAEERGRARGEAAVLAKATEEPLIWA